jgi:hypothetical protein
MAWQQSVERKRRQSLMALQQNISVGAWDVIVDIAFKKNVSAKNRAGRFIE